MCGEVQCMANKVRYREASSHGTVTRTDSATVAPAGACIAWWQPLLVVLTNTASTPSLVWSSKTERVGAACCNAHRRSGVYAGTVTLMAEW
jgi:hypothetical protein